MERTQARSTARGAGAKGMMMSQSLGRRGGRREAAMMRETDPRRGGGKFFAYTTYNHSSVC